MVIISGVPIFKIFTVIQLKMWVSPLRMIPNTCTVRLANPLQNNPNNLDHSYKMDLDLWDCFGGNPTSYSRLPGDYRKNSKNWDT